MPYNHAINTHNKWFAISLFFYVVIFFNQKFSRTHTILLQTMSSFALIRTVHSVLVTLILKIKKHLLGVLSRCFLFLAHETFPFVVTLFMLFLFIHSSILFWLRGEWMRDKKRERTIQIQTYSIETSNFCCWCCCCKLKRYCNTNIHSRNICNEYSLNM